jgi:CRISPR-associated endonuclease/helicase Cas3
MTLLSSQIPVAPLKYTFVPLAHSAKLEKGIEVQYYHRHVHNVLLNVDESLARLQPHLDPRKFQQLRAIVRLAAVFHDLGKLDLANQKVIDPEILMEIDEEGKYLLANRNDGSRRLPVNHVDAGVAYLIKVPTPTRLAAALLIWSHHIGLPALDCIALGRKEVCPSNGGWRSPACEDRVDRFLAQMLQEHKAVCQHDLTLGEAVNQIFNPMYYRIALSILCDADHFDTAKNYGDEVKYKKRELRASERLAQLKACVANKRAAELADMKTTVKQSRAAKGMSLQFRKLRQTLRDLCFEACSKAILTEKLLSCGIPVGGGKTFSYMASALKFAQEQGMDKIMVLSPYTSLIDQSSEVYLGRWNENKKEFENGALILPDETYYGNQVVASLHHRASYDHGWQRKYSSRWKAPIILTTLVQGCETFASNHPSDLRKLHELPGTVIVIDETQTALPNRLWTQTWKWLKFLTEECHCIVIFASGTPVDLWNIKEIVDVKDRVPVQELIPFDARFAELARLDRNRVKFQTHKKPFKLEGLSKFILSKQGPRLCAMSTIANAAISGDQIETDHREIISNDKTGQLGRKGRKVVYCLSTALAPRDRTIILNKVKRRLDVCNKLRRAIRKTKSQISRLVLKTSNADIANMKVLRKNLARLLKRSAIRNDFTLIGTSCIECGMDISFRVGFRQRSSLMSIHQLGGRVNRNFEYGSYPHKPCDVWDFEIIKDGKLSDCVAFRWAKKVLNDLIREGSTSASDCKEAMEREMNERGRSMIADVIDDAERHYDFKTVKEVFKVIAANCLTVVIDKRIVEKISRNEMVSFQDIINSSVRVRIEAKDKWNICEIQNASEVEEGDLSEAIDYMGKKGVRSYKHDSCLYEFGNPGFYDPNMLGYMHGVLKGVNPSDLIVVPDDSV